MNPSPASWTNTSWGGEGEAEITRGLPGGKSMCVLVEYNRDGIERENLKVKVKALLIVTGEDVSMDFDGFLFAACDLFLV